jgi:hypothetical protein
MNSKNKQVVHEIVRKLDLDLRALTLKAGGIVDSFDEAEKAFQRDHEHVDRVHDDAHEDLLKDTSHKVFATHILKLGRLSADCLFRTI